MVSLALIKINKINLANEIGFTVSLIVLVDGGAEGRREEEEVKAVHRRF